MATTGTKTVRQIVNAAFKKAGIAGFEDPITAYDLDQGIDELDMMLKDWQNQGYNLWTKTGGTLNLTTSASYTLSPARPLQILSARYKESSSANELPMQELTREEYDNLPNKSSTGTPTQFYYDRQREDALFYVWPVLASASAQTIEYTYTREIEDHTDADQVVDVPGEFWSAVVHNLALRLRDTYELPPRQVLTAMAAGLLDQALSYDREGSVFFAGPNA
jgi:hypothetical protein